MSKAITNGEIWLNGKLYLMCGDELIPIRKVDSTGVPIVPPKEKQ